VKVVKKYTPLTIMKELSKYLEISIADNDEDFFYDRMYFMKHNYDYDFYKSDDLEDMEAILWYDLESVNILINQILRFGRIVYSTDNSTIYNFPKKNLPSFYLKDIFSKNKQNTIKEGMNNDKYSKKHRYK